MSDNQQEMIEYTTQDVIKNLVEEKQLSLEKAMDAFYLSDTFTKLSDVDTGLYLEGSDYIYELLMREKAGKL